MFLTFSLSRSMYMLSESEMEALKHEISGYPSKELSSVNTLHELKLYSTSQTREQSYAPVYCIYSLSIDYVFMLDVVPYTIQEVLGRNNRLLSLIRHGPY
jgi:hypothetical protein